MFRSVVIANIILITACGGTSPPSGIDAPLSAACMEATTYQDITSIENKIFKASCIFQGCHNGGATLAGMMDLRAGAARAHTVGIASVVDTSGGRKVVEPGDISKSYMMVMLQSVPPAAAMPPTVDPPTSIGFMPQNTGGMPICQEKRDAIGRWITAGALP